MSLPTNICRRRYVARSGLILCFFISIGLLGGCTKWGPVPTAGLKPSYPQYSKGAFSSRWDATVESLQPTFHWQDFPTSDDMITDITYDFRIWRAKEDVPGRLIYHRERLADSSHTIEQPLEPSTAYFWSVRARYKRGGQVRVSEWTKVVLTTQEQVEQFYSSWTPPATPAPTEYYLPFHTPSAP